MFYVVVLAISLVVKGALLIILKVRNIGYMKKEAIEELLLDRAKDGHRQMYRLDIMGESSTSLYSDDKLESLGRGLRVMDSMASNSLINFQPEIFINNGQANIVPKSSSVHMKIQSLATKSLVYDEKMPVRHPYPNKKYVAGYSFVNRKRLSGLLHSPALSEAVSYSEFLASAGYGSDIFIDWRHTKDFEYIEQLLLDKELLIDPDYKYKTLPEYLDYKYTVYSYLISENWTISFDVDGEIFSVPILIEYYSAIFKYSDDYLSDHGIAVAFHYADSNDRTIGSSNYTDYGHIPCLMTSHAFDIELAYDTRDDLILNKFGFHYSGGNSAPSVMPWRYEIISNYLGQDLSEKHKLLADDTHAPLLVKTKEIHFGGLLPVTGVSLS